jgi:hypothetical protein
MLQVPADPLVMARAYLRQTLAARDITVPIGVEEPRDQLNSFVLLSLAATSRRSTFTYDYLIRVRVFDKDAERCGLHAHTICALLLDATHKKITLPDGSAWVSGVEHQAGPSQLADPDMPLHGLQIAVFWTVAWKAS